VDAMIVSRKMPKKKNTTRALKLSTKCLKSKTQPNISKLLRIVKKQLQSLLPSKATMF
jgi:hypothetical protein